MPNDTLTLSLSGDVTLGQFADSMQRLQALVDALVRATRPGIAMSWIIEELEAGSATATVRGECEDPAAVEQVISAYQAVGLALSEYREVPYGPTVARHARELVSVLDGTIASLRFATDSLEYIVRSGGEPGKPPARSTFAYGAIRGTVQTLQRRRGLKFVLYDLLFDRPITCEVKAEHEPALRELWGRKVIVTGHVGRDPITHLPTIINDITSIVPIEDVTPGTYRQARGILPQGSNAEPPEHTIRRIRDA